MKNIVLIGMPAVGKSTIGVLLAKVMLYHFCDTDLLLQQNCGCSLCDYIEHHGTTDFIRFECETLASLHLQNTVIATGGSAVYGERAMQNLKETGIVVYLKNDPETIKSRIGNIVSRGVVFLHGASVEDICRERTPLYEKYADITIDCNDLSSEECVNQIVRALSLYHYNTNIK